ncbi:MAG: hypothetical protein BKP49_02275 [Treponema sp. CETP13]|nr:MAG: hypothetical protein BKP49_02275 [Treponema sp. CETP13]
MKIFKLNILAIFACLFLFTSNGYCITTEEMTKEQAKQAREDIVEYSKRFIGVPYVVGGISMDGIDCSGLLYTVSHEAIGIQLPRTVSAMYDSMSIVPISQLEPGDAIFFKTVGNEISHVGLYIGKNQFIHSISDGPNTGVICSSLNQTTWHNEFAAVGQFLPPTKDPTTLSSDHENLSFSNKQKTTNYSYLDNISFDAFGSLLWNFLSYNQMKFNLRGADLETHVMYNGLSNSSIIPGFGIRYRFDPGMNIFQMPIFFSVSIENQLRIYAGPVITFGTPVIPGSDEEVSASVFPGIIGVAWQSPDWDVGSLKMCFVQDFAWTVFNNAESGAALPIFESVCTGLTFSTGFRVTLPLSKFIN